MRNYISFLVSLLLMPFLFGCGKRSSEDKSPSQSIQQNVNDLPLMTVTNVDGTPVGIKALKGNIVLILFQSDCDHCQREAKEIKDNLNSFKNYSLYFISADPLPSIEKFGSENNLLNEPNIYFGSTTVESVLNSFGPIPTPSVYIYSNQRLVNKFNGETSIEKILQAI